MEGFARIMVHGDPAFIMEFSKGDMKRPLISPQITHGIPVQPKALADPHTRGTHQKKGICEEVIGLSQFRR
jgi:hypothetical protein